MRIIALASAAFLAFGAIPAQACFYVGPDGNEALQIDWGGHTVTRWEPGTGERGERCDFDAIGDFKTATALLMACAGATYEIGLPDDSKTVIWKGLHFVQDCDPSLSGNSFAWD